MITSYKLFENKQTPKIYLAGGWSNWRNVVKEYFPNVTYLDPITVGGGGDLNKVNWFELETEMIHECDGIIAWVVKDNKSGFGMTYEMGMAFGLNKPYVLINEKEDQYQWSMQTKGADYSSTDYMKVFEWINNTNWLGISK